MSENIFGNQDKNGNFITHFLEFLELITETVEKKLDFIHCVMATELTSW